MITKSLKLIKKNKILNRKKEILKYADSVHRLYFGEPIIFGSSKKPNYLGVIKNTNKNQEEEYLQSYYRLLAVDSNVSLEVLKRAFREKIKKYHSDINKNTEADAYLIIEAYKKIKDTLE